MTRSYLSVVILQVSEFAAEVRWVNLAMKASCYKISEDRVFMALATVLAPSGSVMTLVTDSGDLQA